MRIASQWLRRFAHRAFYEFHTREFRVVNDILAAATIASVAALVLETVPMFQGYALLWSAVEYTAVALFLVEYLFRLATERSPLAYVTSFYGIIDLLAILPTLLGVGNLTALKSARALRILKFLRIIRLSKIARLAVDEARRELADLESYRDIFRFDLTIYGLTLSSATVFLGGLLYYVEPANPSFTHIPGAMYWVFGVIFGGMPGIHAPSTVPGLLIYFLARFVGIVLLGFLASIIGRWVEHRLFSQKKHGVD